MNYKNPIIRLDRQKGFTIVELLVVIVVIGILAAITVVSYSGIQERSRIARANDELRLLNQAINVARINEDKTLILVTGSNCTRCFNQATYELSIDRIAAASGMNISALKKGDPWGNKYSIDENEGEGASPCSGRDSIGLTTPGKVGVYIPTVNFYQCAN